MSDENQINLSNFLKYSLGYVKLINPVLSRYKIQTEPIEPDVLTPDIIFSSKSNTENNILLNLNEFYQLNPKDLTDENKESYQKQKEFAVKLEEIKNKFKINEYTKEINLNFGFFKIEIPEDEDVIENEEGQIKRIKNDLLPLFSIPIEIVNKDNKYFIKFLDSNIIPNIGFLHDVLDQDVYFDLASYINSFELNNYLTLPLQQETIIKIWDELKSKLKLSKAQFDEKSFKLERFVISLSSKSNYFLVQDLKSLSEKPEENLTDTSLDSWISDEGLDIEEDISEKDGELFFPFDYDKHQLKVLSIVNNKAAIVQGPPGTGKSQTIANILCHLAAKNKRILFLSQKAQALKVVKDKLKGLNIDYLSGYIPSKHSYLYGSDEEKDGAANTLVGIAQYISSFQNKKVKSDKDIITYDFHKIADLFNDSVEKQRHFYNLYTQYNQLVNYDIGIASPQSFIEGFDLDEYERLLIIENEIENLESVCGLYIKTYGSSSELDKIYDYLPIVDNNYSEKLNELINEIKEKGFDRAGKLNRSIFNLIFKFKIRDILKTLPREIFDEFHKVINKDQSKHQCTLELGRLKDYFFYKESDIKLRSLREQKEVKLSELGLTDNSYNKIKQIIKEEGKEAFSKIKSRIEIEQYMKVLELTQPNEINSLFSRVKLDRKERVKNYLKNRIFQQIKERTVNATVKGVIARIAKALTKSKKAYKTFDKLKGDPTNFQVLKDIIPIWIMDLEDVSRIIPLEKNLFDYIVLDESSQCNIAYALPAMYRSKHVIFFGDSEQMRDDSIKFKTNRSLLELANKFTIPDYAQIKSQDDSVKSVLDIGHLRGFKETNLLYHYRSPIELIGFSNDNFYAPKGKKMDVINSNYVPYKNTNKVLINHFIEANKEQDSSEKTNLAEVKFIKKLILELKQDDNFKDKSVGVLTFFNEQAFLLREYIDDDSIKVSVIEGIQGDEKDIIIYSFVISSPDQKNRYIPLTFEEGEILKGINAGRVNVAFSRAKEQVHCVTSLPLKEWPEGIWIKKYLQYVEESGEINFFNQEIKEFDSDFEKEFYYFLKGEFNKDYIIQNQVESCGFRIDFVITDIESKQKLAIECDGPTHFEEENNESYIQTDIERQFILESAGWDFYRVLYSDWQDENYDKALIIKDIKNYFRDSVQFYSKFESYKPTNQELIIEQAEEEQEFDSYSTKISGEETAKTNIISKTSDQENETQTIPESTEGGNFKELLNFQVNDNKNLVASIITGEQCLWINEYIKTAKYSGFTKTGIGIALSDLQAFIDKSVETIKTKNPNYLTWKGKGKSKIMIRMAGASTVDIRHYVESRNFTGFTRRGFNLNQDQFIEFLNALVEAINSQS